MPNGSIIAMILGMTVTAIVIIAFVVTFVKIAQKAQQQKTQQEYSDRYREKQTQSAQNRQVTLAAEQKEKLDYIRQYHKDRIAADERDKHQKDADEHAHMGEEEHYEEIVGSLGEVNDEGCEDLSGVRFIAHDIAYDVSDGESHDYTKVAQAMVLGEILNQPRFKKPYSNRK